MKEKTFIWESYTEKLWILRQKASNIFSCAEIIPVLNTFKLPAYLSQL